MAVETRSELRTASLAIKNEAARNGVTAAEVGGLFENVVDSMEMGSGSFVVEMSLSQFGQDLVASADNYVEFWRAVGSGTISSIEIYCDPAHEPEGDVITAVLKQDLTTIGMASIPIDGNFASVDISEDYEDGDMYYAYITNVGTTTKGKNLKMRLIGTRD